MTTKGQVKNKKTSQAKSPINDFASSLKQEEYDRIISKLNKENSSEESLKNTLNFGKYIALELNMDWNQMTAEDQTIFTVEMTAYYSDFLSNLLRDVEDSSIQNSITMYIRKGFDESILQKNDKLQKLLELFNLNFINTLKNEII